MTDLAVKNSSKVNKRVHRSKSTKTKSINKIICDATCICPKHMFSSEEKDFMQLSLLNWYDKNQRKLPWRDIAKSENDPDKRGYAVWVSEVMLQQTQVATVIPYYNKWLKKWPTVSALAAANLEEVNQVWAGLGYYSRAKRLHEGAQIINATKGSLLPQNSEELKNDVPGIGKYTACAIASVAYQQVVGVVDGNVMRVLSRLRAIGSDISKPFSQQHLWKVANDIVSHSRPGDFNQALMEFGAVLCTPRNPKCDSCPLNSICIAYAMENKGKPKLLLSECKSSKNVPLCDIENSVNCQLCITKALWKSNPEVTVFPVKAQKKTSRVERVSVVVVERNDGFLLMMQRPKHGLLAGLWEFPSVLLAGTSSEKTELSNWLKTIGLPTSTLKRTHVGEVVHIFSHIHTTYVVDHLMLDHVVDVQTDQKIKWLQRSEIESTATSTAMKKIIRLVDESINKANKTKVSGRKRKHESPSKKKQSRMENFFSK